MLAERRRAWDVELAGIRKEEQRAKRAARCATRTVSRQWVLHEYMIRTVLIIYALCDGAATPAAKYLASVAVQQKWPQKNDEELRELVLSSFENAGVEELFELTDEARPTCIYCMRNAQVYCLEWRLKQWASKLNATLGETPSVDVVLQRWDLERRRLPVDIRPRSRSREWVRLWAARWDGAIDTLRAGDQPPLADKLTKVAMFIPALPTRKVYASWHGCVAVAVLAWHTTSVPAGRAWLTTLSRQTGQISARPWRLFGSPSEPTSAPFPPALGAPAPRSLPSRPNRF